LINPGVYVAFLTTKFLRLFLLYQRNPEKENSGWRRKE